LIIILKLIRNAVLLGVLINQTLNVFKSFLFVLLTNTAQLRAPCAEWTWTTSAPNRRKFSFYQTTGYASVFDGLLWVCTCQLPDFVFLSSLLISRAISLLMLLLRTRNRGHVHASFSRCNSVNRDYANPLGGDIRSLLRHTSIETISINAMSWIEGSGVASRM